ncbi:aminoacylase-1A isoform X1 [Folsomia candida]|uniref:N-acyl-aliphatic-L-amino acid amidohydrolase n=1 Tax=Folsomia candida TaxID=158441 RepID=A0A226EVX9_FOLCA|nr:aminoacylase-1A isoform X1 [Folsomia candida]OXA61001.1 Aminoacylase-1A [Folsomia candida]
MKPTSSVRILHFWILYLSSNVSIPAWAEPQHLKTSGIRPTNLQHPGNRLHILPLLLWSKRPSSGDDKRTTKIPSNFTILPPEDPSVSRYREYLRTNTSHPNPNYDTAVAWIKEQAQAIGIEYKKIDFDPPGLFIIRLKWPGSDPMERSSLLLNSHIDVVPVDSSKWTYDAFAAVKDDKGNIYGRGAQDRKSQGAQYLEAIRRLKMRGFSPRRTVYVTFVPDEEVGGDRGMATFLKASEFMDMNVSLALDEGAATMDDVYPIFYGERSVFRVRITATGRSSHTAMMLKDNAATKLNKALGLLFVFRDEQINASNPDGNIENVTSINLSQIGGGTSPNAVPSEIWAIVDMRLRLRPTWTFSNLTNLLDSICNQSGNGVSYKVLLNLEIKEESSLSESDFWWRTIRKSFDEMGWKMKPQIFAGASDARHLRKAGIQAYGFSPLLFTEQLGHQDNEFLNENTFLNGITVYEKLIPKLANARE